MAAPKQTTAAFDPNDHMITLKQKKYLPVAPRIVWVRQEHPECTIETECVYADEATGSYRFKATVSFLVTHGDEVVTVRGVGHGAATRKEFPSGPGEKAETKAIGRALAFLGYGTLNAQELEEDDQAIMADSPQPATSTSMGIGEMRNAAKKMLETDTEAGGKLPKAIDDCNDEEAAKAYAWLMRRKQAAGTAGK